MNFKDYITKFKNECNLRLIDNNIKQEEITKKIEEVNKELRRLNNIMHKPFSLPLIGGLFGGTSLGFMASLMFQTPLWIIYLILSILIALIGVLNEAYSENREMDKLELTHELRELYHQDRQIKNEKSHLISLVNDLSTCCDYYNYIVDKSKKTKGIAMRMQPIFDSNCLLSTFLDKYYNGELQEFLNLPDYMKKKEEARLKLNEKIFTAKQEKVVDDLVVLPRRRRRDNILYFHQPEETRYLRRA